MRRSALYILLSFLLFLGACSEHGNKDVNNLRIDSLCTELSGMRYSDKDSFDSVATALLSISNDDNEIQMVATNAMAYSAMMQMDYARSMELYSYVLENSECEIECLAADVGLMTLCYRVSANRQFFDYRTDALAKIRRINEELQFISESDRERFYRACVEFDIVSVCYFSNLAMFEEAAAGIRYLERNLENITNPSLRKYAQMFIAAEYTNAEERINALAMGLNYAENNNILWLKANYELLLAISLRDDYVLDDFTGKYPERVAAHLPEGVTAMQLPYILASKAVTDFSLYGDRYMMIEAMAVKASCCIHGGKFEEAVDILNMAYGNIEDYYYCNSPAVPISVQDSLLYYMDNTGGYATDIDAGIYNIPECILGVCREASCAYAGLGNKEASDFYREAYLELLRTTRLNKLLESRTSHEGEKLVGLRLTVSLLVVLLLIILVLFSFAFHRRYYRRKKYSDYRRRLLDTSRLLLSFLPHDVESKEDLCNAISVLLNEYLGDIAGKTYFVFGKDVPGNCPYVENFDIRYMNTDACDTLTVASSLPLDGYMRDLVSMLLPYVSVAVEEGLHLADISDECEKVEEMKRASAIYLAEHKRENLLKRVSLSIVSGMRPYMDRISNELNVLQNYKSLDDRKRKLQYVTELTDKLEDLNIILERWIKMRQGELSLKIENFSLADIFSIIERNRTFFENRGLVLDVVCGGEIVKADRALTLFMINTLVDNAAKFTPEGGKVTLESMETQSYVEISVTDTGIGLSQSDIDSIVGTKVYDASLIGGDNEMLQPKSKGGGFGLINCKGIIEKYRKTDSLFSVCSFNVSSVKGNGSRFSFRLPKGILRCMLLLMTLLPMSLTASDNVFGKINEYADSVFISNVDGDYEKAFRQAGMAIGLLNDYYMDEIGGNDTLSVTGGNFAELDWWQEDVFPDSLNEDIYYNILDIRNELSIASLALKDWDSYRYNNRIYSTLYRLVHEDRGIEREYAGVKKLVGRYEVAIALLTFVIAVLIVCYFISFVRYNVIEKSNERLVLELNGRLLHVAALKRRRGIEELASDFVNEIYNSVAETMHVAHVSMLLDTGAVQKCISETGERGMYTGSDVYMQRVFEEGKTFVSLDGLLYAIPLSVVNDGKRLPVGALELSTERPLSENEIVCIDLVAGYLSSVAYHSVMRVASGYMALDELEEETARLNYEENRMHVQNMVMDNCLSVIKHETIYYPSRIKELALSALSSSVKEKDIADMSELMSYYSSIFGILTNCAMREIDTMGFTFEKLHVSLLFEHVVRFVERMARKGRNGIKVVYEPTDAVICADRDLVEYLLEQLLSAALRKNYDGTLLLRATDAGDVVKVEFVDNRYELTSEEQAELFVPSRSNINSNGCVISMEYLVAREIVRLHEDYTGKHGGRMEVRSDVSGTTILFTLPK